jgi:murein DD-endopeptidase MepM/ murein hydrolase activator NlpD
MLLSPIQSTALKDGECWKLIKPYITQDFGGNYEMYKQFGLKGHNGIDLRAKTGTVLFSPIEGVIYAKDDGNSGYGLHVKIRKDNLELIIGHLSEVDVKLGEWSRISLGDKIGLSGDSGFSTAPHVHLGMRFWSGGAVKNYDNGFLGYIDPTKYILCWKGTLLTDSL